MRIFLSCLQSTRKHVIPAYAFWEPYFKSGIAEAGHDWVEAPAVDWAEGLALSQEHDLRRWRERTWSEVLRVVRAGRGVDVFLGYLYPQMIDAAAVREIRRLGVACVNFFCDNVREFRDVPAPFLEFDLNWVPEAEALPMYERAGCRHVLAPMPCWIAPPLRRADHPETTGVTFIGSVDPLRRHLLGSAIARGANLSIAGPGWRDEGGRSAVEGDAQHSPLRTLCNQWMFVRKQGWLAWGRKIDAIIRPLPQPSISVERLLGTVSDVEYVRLIQQSTITLGVNRVPSFQRTHRRPFTYSRLRDLEAPMMGACYLTEWTEGLARFYDLGRQIETYRTAEDLADKIQRLLADPARRRELRVRGQEHALHELSVARSLEKVAGALGLSRPSP